VASSAAIIGGALVGLGAFLPWVTFYAGLVPMSGVIGLYGRLLAAGGGVCLLAGAWLWLRPTRWLRRALALFGIGIAAFAIWLTVQLCSTYYGLKSNQMIVPQLGPGLFVALGGALLASGGTALSCLRARPRGEEAERLGEAPQHEPSRTDPGRPLQARLR